VLAAWPDPRREPSEAVNRKLTAILAPLLAASLLGVLAAVVDWPSAVMNTSAGIAILLIMVLVRRSFR
jgi:hypothetical protein